MEHIKTFRELFTYQLQVNRLYFPVTLVLFYYNFRGSSRKFLYTKAITHRARGQSQDVGGGADGHSPVYNM